jgi:hypothetical protein
MIDVPTFLLLSLADESADSVSGRQVLLIDPLLINFVISTVT